MVSAVLTHPGPFTGALGPPGAGRGLPPGRGGSRTFLSWRKVLLDRPPSAATALPSRVSGCHLQPGPTYGFLPSAEHCMQNRPGVHGGPGPPTAGPSWVFLFLVPCILCCHLALGRSPAPPRPRPVPPEGGRETGSGLTVAPPWPGMFCLVA